VAQLSIKYELQELLSECQTILLSAFPVSLEKLDEYETSSATSPIPGLDSISSLTRLILLAEAHPTAGLKGYIPAAYLRLCTRFRVLDVIASNPPQSMMSAVLELRTCVSTPLLLRLGAFLQERSTKCLERNCQHAMMRFCVRMNGHSGGPPDLRVPFLPPSLLRQFLDNYSVTTADLSQASICESCKLGLMSDGFRRELLWKRFISVSECLPEAEPTMGNSAMGS
jgi:hypothetical protein